MPRTAMIRWLGEKSHQVKSIDTHNTPVAFEQCLFFVQFGASPKVSRHNNKKTMQIAQIF